MPDKTCEHRNQAGGTTCTASAIFIVCRGRKHDAQLSCRYHLADTVDALAEGQAVPVMVRLVHAQALDGLRA
jgi:hypothetical protein